MNIIPVIILLIIIYFMYLPIFSIINIQKNAQKWYTHTDMSKHMNMFKYKSPYIFYPGIIPQNKTHGNPGYMHINVPGRWNNNNYHKLEITCTALPKCIAHDTDGNLFSETGPLSTWKRSKDPKGGTFVHSKYRIPTE